MQKADWRRLCFTLSKSLCLRALHLTSVAKVEIIIDQKPTHSKYKGKPANTGDIRKFVWTDRNGGRSTSGEMTSVRSSGECEFLAELSLFALQKSSGATLYKWAKFLSILNIILTSQQNELLPTNKNQRQTVDNLTARTLLNFAENISGLSNVTRLRAGSHYRQFGRKLITLWTKICQHISFLMRPLICDCSKIPKPGKNIRDAGVLGWGWPILPNIEKPKEPAAKAVNSLKEWLSILTAKSRTWKRARSFIIHTNVFIACGSKLQHGQARFSLSLLRPLNAEKWAVFLPSGPGQNTPNLACCGRRTKETLESLLPCSAAWQVSWLNTISLLKFFLCDGHLHFTCWNTTARAQFIFISGLKQFDFPADFFEPKEKLVCHKTRCHSGFGPPLPNFPLKNRLYHIWWLILFASFLSMFFSITTQYSSIKVKKTAILFQFCRIY